MRAHILMARLLVVLFPSMVVAGEAPPVFSWTGFYAGVSGGLGGGEAPIRMDLATGGVVIARDRFSDRSTGVLLGGQIGFNYQFANRFVAGLEADWSWAHIDGRRKAVINHVAPPRVEVNDAFARTEHLGTLRARFGYASGRFLPFFTAGLAWGGLRQSFNIADTTGYAATGGGSALRMGWTVGAGLEYALGNALSFRTEYLFVQLPGFGVTVRDTAGFVNPTSLGRSSGHLVRVGLNYRFGADGGVADGAAPFAPTWSGVHLGLNGGYGGSRLSGGADGYNPANVLFQRQQASTRAGGLFAGGQVGYDMRLADRIILGVETDLQLSDLRSRSTTSHIPLFLGASTRQVVTTHLEYFGTARARIGYAVGQALPYLTGGFAYGGWKAESSLAQSTGYRSFGAADKIAAGWTLGAGLEYALSPSLSVKAEYLRLNLGGFGLTINGNNGNRWPGSSNRSNVDILRAGLNWRFDGAPVVARY